MYILFVATQQITSGIVCRYGLAWFCDSRGLPFYRVVYTIQYGARRRITY